MSTDNYNNEVTNDNEIIKSVLESKVNDTSGDTVLMKRESSNKRVVKERLCLQRANFSCGVNGAKTPIMSYEDRVSSSNNVRDKVSRSRSPFRYHKLPERIRMGYDNVMLPFVWSDRNKVRWCQDCLLYTSRCV